MENREGGRSVKICEDVLRSVCGLKKKDSANILLLPVCCVQDEEMYPNIVEPTRIASMVGVSIVAGRAGYHSSATNQTPGNRSDTRERQTKTPTDDDSRCGRTCNQSDTPRE
jgi:hypothetical protein